MKLYTVFPHIRPKVTVHKFVENYSREETIQGKKLFKGGNYSRKYGILLTSLNNQISEFWIPNIYNEIFFILFSAWFKVGPTVIL